MFLKTEPASDDVSSHESHPIYREGRLFDCCNSALEQYKCPACENFQTDCLTVVRHHIRDSHLQFKRVCDLYKCKVCHFETYSEFLLTRHGYKCDRSDALTKCEKGGVRCEYCLCDYANEKRLATHVKRLHLNWLHCTHCAYKTKHRPFLAYHLKILHKNEFHQCSLCAYRAKASSSLKNHRILKHGLGHWLQCGHCTYKAVARWRMLQHQKRHKSVPNLQYYITDKNLTEWLNCEQCNFKTKSEAVLKRHHMDRHSNLFNCQKSQIDEYECRCGNFKTHLLAQLHKHAAQGHALQVHREIQNYRCQNCDVNSYSEYLFIRHKLFKQCAPKEKKIRALAPESEESRKNVKWLRCGQCPYVTKSNHCLKSHLNTHDKTLKCDKCAYATASNDSLRRHMNIIHGEHYQWFRCAQCPFKSKFRGNLSKHLRIHNFDWIKCDLCFFKTKHAHNLNLHKKWKHDIGTKWFNCDVCIFQTKRKYSLKLHKETLHGISIPRNADQWLQCKRCPFRSQSRDEFRVHQKDHEEKKHQCPYCPHRTKRGYNLKLHVIQKHSDKTEIQWLQCDQCDFRTKTKSILKRHVLERHSEEWVYCAQCAFKARSKRLLINHLQAVHNVGGNIKIYQCIYCEYTSKQKTNLNKHVEMHEKRRVKLEGGN